MSTATPTIEPTPIRDASGKIRAYEIDGQRFRTKGDAIAYASDRAFYASDAFKNATALVEANDAANEGRPAEDAPELSADDEARVAREAFYANDDDATRVAPDVSPAVEPLDESLALSSVPREGDPDAQLDSELIESETYDDDVDAIIEALANPDDAEPPAGPDDVSELDSPAGRPDSFVLSESGVEQIAQITGETPEQVRAAAERQGFVPVPVIERESAADHAARNRAERERVAAEREDAQTRVAQMPADELPPVPDSYVSAADADKPAPTRKRREGSYPRIVAGRLRSRESAERYAIENVDSKWSEHAGSIRKLRDAVSALDLLVDEYVGDESRIDESELQRAHDRVRREVHDAWIAGLPTTAIGSIIGASGGRARGLAVEYAQRYELSAPRPTRVAKREHSPERPIDVAARYSDALTPVYVAALAGDGLVNAIVDAYKRGLPVNAIARCAGIPSSRVTKLATQVLKSVPTADERKAAREAIELPELPDD